VDEVLDMGRHASSLSDLKEIGCKSVWPVHISTLFWAIERLLPCKIVKICPRPAKFSLRFFKSDRLLVDQYLQRVMQKSKPVA
jgi:hypothetical protein